MAIFKLQYALIITRFLGLINTTLQALGVVTEKQYTRTMSNVFVGLLLGAGCAAWVYSKMMRSSGSNTQKSLTAAGFAFVAAFVVVLILMSVIPK